MINVLIVYIKGNLNFKYLEVTISFNSQSNANCINIFSFCVNRTYIRIHFINLFIIDRKNVVFYVMNIELFTLYLHLSDKTK